MNSDVSGNLGDFQDAFSFQLAFHLYKWVWLYPCGNLGDFQDAFSFQLAWVWLYPYRIGLCCSLGFLISFLLSLFHGLCAMAFFNCLLKRVIRIRDILIRIRNRILGSVHWITDPDPSLSGSTGNFQDANKKSF